MFFPDAFSKLLVGTSGFTYTATKKSVDLTAGQIGILDASSNAQVQVAAAGVPASIQGLPQIYLAQGSFKASDKLGGTFHGGYKESIKTKGISPNYIHRLFVSTPKESQEQKILIGGSTKAQLFECGKVLNLRVDVKGGPVLSTLSHNLYETFMASTGCCPINPADSKIVDPAIVFEQWADQINSHVVFKPFVLADVKYGIVDVNPANPAVITDAKPANWDTVSNTLKFCQLEIDVIYLDSAFGDNSYRRFDKVQDEHISVYASLVDDLDNLCHTPSLPVAELQPFKYSEGSGEYLLKDLMLFNEYRQDPWHADQRLRDVFDNTEMSQINRSQKYFVYNILHSVPRKRNGGSVLDSDFYLVKIVVNARNANFEAFMEAYAKLGSGVKFEVI